MDCVLCNEPIKTEPITGWKYGHNAQPLADGQCCRDCNDERVLPARLEALSDHLQKLEVRRG